MSHPLHHSISSQRKWGGHVDDYLPIHSWFDETRVYFRDMRHRAMRHHIEGIFWCEQKFGAYITNSEGRMIPVRAIGEQHCIEDVGFVPSISDYLENMSMKNWMFKPGDGRRVLREIEQEKLDYVNKEEENHRE